jgi:hypothetical protein
MLKGIGLINMKIVTSKKDMMRGTEEDGRKREFK